MVPSLDLVMLGGYDRDRGTVVGHNTTRPTVILMSHAHTHTQTCTYKLKREREGGREGEKGRARERETHICLGMILSRCTMGKYSLEGGNISARGGGRRAEEGSTCGARR